MYFWSYIGVSEKGNEAKSWAGQDLAGGRIKEDDIGLRHNTVSLLCQTGLERWTISGEAARFFVLAAACCRGIERIETYAIRRLSPFGSPVHLRTTINSWVILIVTPWTRSGRPACPIGINSFNERARVTWRSALLLARGLPLSTVNPPAAFLNHRWAVNYTRSPSRVTRGNNSSRRSLDDARWKWCCAGRRCRDDETITLIEIESRN